MVIPGQQAHLHNLAYGDPLKKVVLHSELQRKTNSRRGLLGR